MNEKPVFVILGAGGFPYSFSAVSNKFFFVAKALILENFDVILINKFNISDKVIKESGSFESIKYSYLSGVKKRETYLSKIIGEFIASIRLFFLLKSLRTKSQRNYLLVSINPLISIIYYRILANVFSYKLIFSIMEYHESLANNLFSKIKSYLFWNYSFRFADAIIPISKYLQDLIKTKQSKLPIYKLPILADYNDSRFKTAKAKDKCFLYCGSIGFHEVINLIINSFLKLNCPDVRLNLVLYGDLKKIEELEYSIKDKKMIKVYYGLSKDELYQMYSRSLGLLIPLRPTIQDNARFPQKIAEYLASGSTIITNNVGEIQYYFSNGVDAIFVEDYSVDAFSDAMQFVLDNPDKSKEIGERGRILGYKYFHYESIAKEFSEFILSI